MLLLDPQDLVVGLARVRAEDSWQLFDDNSVTIDGAVAYLTAKSGG